MEQRANIHPFATVFVRRANPIGLPAAAADQGTNEIGPIRRYVLVLLLLLLLAFVCDVRRFVAPSLRRCVLCLRRSVYHMCVFVAKANGNNNCGKNVDRMDIYSHGRPTSRAGRQIHRRRRRIE